MKRFACLFMAIDRTTRTSEKTAALRDYFADAPAADAAWALSVLTGRKLIRAVNSKRLRAWLSEASGLPAWLVAESYDAVGDLSETIALLLPPPAEGPIDEPLHEVIERRILPLPKMDEAEQRASIMDTWASLDTEQRFLFHKLISGSFRVGAGRKLVVRGLAEAAGAEPAVMEHRVMGFSSPTAQAYQKLWHAAEGEHDPGRPYPFYLAHPLDDPLDTLGEPGDWHAEWKWDGIRAQIIHRHGEVMAWSRGEEIITGGFPELREVGEDLPGGTVLDGELLAWEGDAPLPFSALQKRLNRKGVQPMLFAETPVAFMAYDVLEHDGEDVREQPLEARRAMLEKIAEGVGAAALRVSPAIGFSSWDKIDKLQSESRERGVEGVMLKRRGSPYRVGRVRGDWWKRKVDPYTVDCVMIYAQRGHGRRASLFSDYTFGVWDNEQDPPALTPVTKAYSGLTDEELDRVDRWIKRHTLEKKGPVRFVEQALVFELAFEGIAASKRHRSGIALRFPRMARWREDLKPKDADTLAFLQRLLGKGRAVPEESVEA